MFKKLVSRSNNARKAPSRQAIGVVQWAQLFRIAHILPGRVRLRFKALKGCATTANNLQSHLGSVEGIRRVEINPLTGSLLLGYDPCSLRSPQFLDAFSEAWAELRAAVAAGDDAAMLRVRGAARDARAAMEADTGGSKDPGKGKGQEGMGKGEES